MKRLMCLLLALVMVFSLLGVSAFAEETEDDDESMADVDVEDTDTDAENEDEDEDEDEVEDGSILTASLDDGEEVTVTLNYNLPSGLTAEGVVAGVNNVSYSWQDNTVTAGSNFEFSLYGGYKLADSAGVTIESGPNYSKDGTGLVFAWYTLSVSGETDTVTLNIVEDPDAPTAVKVTAKLPSDTTADEVIYSEPKYYESWILVGSESGISDSIKLWSGYALDETAGIEITSHSYTLEGGTGEMYVRYSYTITGETDTVELNIVENPEAPYAIKITYAGDLKDYYNTSYMYSTEFASLDISTVFYDINVTGAADVKISAEYSDRVIYAIYPEEGVTEITISGTKKEAGTLAVTGATDQVISIQKWDSEAGEYVDVAAGDTVEADEYLYVILKQGYVIEEGSKSDWASDYSTNTYYVGVGSILSDGVATLNIAQGAVLAYAGDVENGKRNGNDEDWTYAMGTKDVVTAQPGYIAEIDGADISSTYYNCDSETGEVWAQYVYTVTSAGTITVTFREAKEGELPDAIKVNYTGETDGLSSGVDYVMPGDSFTLRFEDGYTAEVTGASLSNYSSNNRARYSVDEDATEVTVNIVKIAEESTLKVVGDETVEDVSEVVVDDADTVADGDALESGVNTFRVVNGYEIKGVTGAVYYKSGYVTDSDGSIYLEYILIPTDDPAEVTVTVGQTAEWVTVNFINNTDHYASIGDYREQGKILNVDTLTVGVREGFTVKVTGGTVIAVDNASVTGIYYEIQPNEGATELTIEVISVDDLSEEQTELGYIDSTNDPAQQTESDDQPDDQPDDKPDDKPDSKPDAKPDGDPGDKGGASGEKAPDTGDETNVTLWAALVAVFAASAGAVLTVLKKKEN